MCMWTRAVCQSIVRHKHCITFRVVCNIFEHRHSGKFCQTNCTRSLAWCLRRTRELRRVLLTLQGVTSTVPPTASQQQTNSVNNGGSSYASSVPPSQSVPLRACQPAAPLRTPVGISLANFQVPLWSRLALIYGS